ncbi:hypothetical protein [Ottowia sp.]|uniref:hypothetical protein n=1 Tax=Ottowia sp. TaxID=1898956 RepID=UPI0039E320DC
MNASANPEKLDYVPGADGMQPGDKGRARVPSTLTFRAGDGPMIEIHPDYKLEIERSPQSMVLSWEEDGQPMNASIPVLEFDAYLADGRIVIER